MPRIERLLAAGDTPQRRQELLGGAAFQHRPLRARLARRLVQAGLGTRRDDHGRRTVAAAAKLAYELGAEPVRQPMVDEQ
jgi:hypothetical protein